jgi:peroxiredoxin
MRFFLVLLLLFCSSIAFSQKAIVLNFDSTVFSDQTIELKRFYKGKTEPVTSFKSGGKKSLVINDLKLPGLYTLTMKGFKNSAEFIYNPAEEMMIGIDMGLSNGEISIEQSKENTCYNDLLKINAVYNTYLDSLQATRRDLHITTADFYGRCFFLDSLYEVVAKEKNGRLTYLQFTYPGTYTSDILIPLNLVPVATVEERGKYQTPDAYLARFYFKYMVPDNRLLNHYGLDDAIIGFLSKYSYPGTDGIKASIDYVTETFKKDTALSSYVSGFLIRTFLDAKNPELALYVMGQVGEGCSFDIGEKQAEYLSSYNHVKVGSQVDDIILNDINGQPVSLSNTCKKGEYTLLLFWTSWCAHCSEFLPELSKMLVPYKNKVQVFGVSLDEEEAGWKGFVSKHQLQSWVHVSELKPIAKSNLAPRFMVTHTPTVYLLDIDRKIVAKNLTKDQLEAELKARIK